MTLQMFRDLVGRHLLPVRHGYRSGKDEEMQAFCRTHGGGE